MNTIQRFQIKISGGNMLNLIDKLDYFTLFNSGMSDIMVKVL
jgi:hypothetical protein